jgi:rhodanese-related sulfurtransferase
MKKKIVLVLSFLFLFSYAYAQDFRNISSDELKSMLDKKSKVIVVDARTAEEHRQGHIPTAINIPPDQLHLSAALLPKDKKSLLVFYCRGAG